MLYESGSGEKNGQDYLRELFTRPDACLAQLPSGERRKGLEY